MLVHVVKDTIVMYKSQLQEYAQKANITPPVYEFVKEGPSHHPRFKASVSVNGSKYDSSPGYANLKSAEHAAAKVALDALHQTNSGAGALPSPVQSGLCKNLLQEYAQKNSLPLPIYHSSRTGEDHAPTFSSSVEIAGVHYSGGVAKSKKEAEIKAARTALLAIQSAQPTAAPTNGASSLPQVALSTLINAQLVMPSNRKRGRLTQFAVDLPALTKVKVQHNSQPGQHVLENTVPPPEVESNQVVNADARVVVPADHMIGRTDPLDAQGEPIVPFQVSDAVAAPADNPLSQEAPLHKVQEVLSDSCDKTEATNAKLGVEMTKQEVDEVAVPVEEKKSLVALINGIAAAKSEEYKLHPAKKAAGFNSLTGSDWRTT